MYNKHTRQCEHRWVETARTYGEAHKYTEHHETINGCYGNNIMPEKHKSTIEGIQGDRTTILFICRDCGDISKAEMKGKIINTSSEEQCN